ncbi:MAG: hypothetical protein U0840_18245 [Gemmataceae bacterium]
MSRTRSGRSRTSARSFLRPWLQRLDDRIVPTARLFLDFGDAFGANGMTVTQGQLSETFANSGLQGPDIGYSNSTPINFTSLGSLVTGVIDYNQDTQLNAQDYTDLKADVLELVQRYFAPFNVDIQVVSSANPAEIRSLMSNNNSNPVSSGIYDTYVITSYAEAQGFSVGFGGLYGIAGVDSGFMTGPPVVNDMDNTVLVFGDTCLDSATLPRQMANIVANTIVHEAGHAFTLYHIDDGSFFTSGAQQLRGTEIMIGGITGLEENDLAQFTRFPLTKGDSNTNLNTVENSYTHLADFARSNLGVRSDPTLVGPNLPNTGTLGATYITGTGAHDIITITATSATTANVTVAPYTTSSYTTLIDIPGTTATTLQYSISIAGGLLIDASLGDDRIIVDGTLGVPVTVRGMGGTDQLIVEGNFAPTAVYTPQASQLTGFDGQADRRGTITVGATTIQFQEFETTGRITIRNVASVTFQSPGGVDNLSLNQVSNALAIQGTIAGGLNFVPLSLNTVAGLIIDAGNNDGAGVADTITLRASPANTGLVSIQAQTGAGDDTLVVNTGALTSTVAFTFDGGQGNDIVDDTTTTDNTWNVTGAGVGSIDGFGFTNVEQLKGNARVDTFNMLGGSLTGGIDGEGGTDALVDGSTNANTWNITGANQGNYTGLGSFINVERLGGGLGTDLFIMNAGGAIGGLDGGAGIDTIQDNSGLSTTAWNITGTGEGGYDLLALFTSIESIVAGTGADFFYVTSAGRLTSIDGGTGNNSLIDTGSNANTWNITGTNSGGYTSVTTFLNIQTLEGGSGADIFSFDAAGSVGSVDGGDGLDSLKDNTGTDNTWIINGVNSFTSDLSAVYSSIEGLIGGTGIDTFLLQSGGKLDGTIDGGAGQDVLEDLTGGNSQWTLTGPNAGTHTSLGGFTAIERITASTGNDTFRIADNGGLTGVLNGNTGTDTLQSTANSGETWQVTGINRGSTNGIVSFLSFESLLGSSGDDQFTFQPGGQITGVVDGASGQDLLNLNPRPGTAVRLLNPGAVDGFNVQVPNSAVGGLRNFDRFLASRRPGDLFQGLNVPAVWYFNNLGLRYQYQGRTAQFGGFDVVRGGTAADQVFIDLNGANPFTSVFTFDGAGGADSISVTGTAGNDNLIGSSNLLQLNNRSLAFTSVEQVTLRGLAGSDRFQITPSASTNFTVFGDSHGAEGDLLVLKRGSLTITSRPTGGSAGVFQFSGALPLSFFGIERIQGDKSMFLPG